MMSIERLSRTVEDFCQFIETRTAEDLSEQAWGPKEILAHLVYYHECYADLVEAQLASATLEPPRGRFSNLNATAVESSRGIPAADLVRRFRSANARLMGVYQRAHPEGMMIEIKAGSRLRRLSDLVSEVEAHIRNHLRVLNLQVTRPKDN